VKGEDWDERYRGTSLLWSEGPNQFVERELASLPAGRALDLAAGEGRNAIWLAERGWRVTAVDFSRVAIDRGRERARDRGVDVTWVVDDVLAWQPPECGFELVLVAYLQLPWAEMERVLARATAAVAPGGTFFLVGHDVENLTRGHGGPRSAEVLYSPAQVAGALGDLDVVCAATVERRVDTPDGPRTALDAVVRATRLDHPRSR
jgi:SAM-dependent methyltransferase